MARFLVDVDGVVAGCMVLMVKEINERFRTTAEGILVNPLKKEHITEFGFMDPKYGILSPGESKFAIENFARPQFAYDMPPLPGAIEGIRKIRAAGHDVVFVTAQWGESVDWCHWRCKWLEQFFDAPLKDVIYAHRKELVSGDVLIEDRDKTCETYAATHPDSLVLMMEQPWNAKHKITQPNIHRFKWRGLDPILKELS